MIGLCKRIRTAVFAIVMCVTYFSSPVDGVEEKAVLSRKALGFYSERESDGRHGNLLTRLIERPLNHLGMLLETRTFKDGFPAEREIGGYRAVILFSHDVRIPGAEPFLDGLTRYAAGGGRVVILGNIPFGRDLNTDAETPSDKLRKFFGLLGVEYDGAWTNNPFRLAVESADRAVVGFEEPPERHRRECTRILNVDGGNAVHLKLADGVAQNEWHPVITGPFGGIALNSFVVADIGGRHKWIVNPFTFLDRALGLTDAPRPDISTENGVRLWFSHIDGDGLMNLSEIAQDGPPLYSGDVVRAHVLEKFDAPVTASFIVARQDRLGPDTAAAIRMAREILRLPNVEPACHGYYHPLSWRKGTLSLSPDKDPAEYVVNDYTDNDTGADVAPDRHFSLELEIDRAVEYINKNLCPAGKKVGLYLWTGDCSPGPEAFLRLERLGLPNMNGGDTIVDPAFPTLTAVAPIGRWVGKYFQVYTGAANENLFTDLWSGNFGGFENVAATFAATETPERIIPINVYYHFYSGEKKASLAAVVNLYKKTLAGAVCPVYAGEYVALAGSFLRVGIVRSGRRTWLIENKGALRTIRFDRAFDVDVANSSNVFGYLKTPVRTYVHLGPGDAAQIRLADAPPDALYLQSATSRVLDFKAGKDAFEIAVRGFNAPSAAVRTGRPDSVFRDESGATVKSDAHGMLVIALPGGGATTVRKYVRAGDAE